MWNGRSDFTNEKDHLFGYCSGDPDRDHCPNDGGAGDGVAYPPAREKADAHTCASTDSNLPGESAPDADGDLSAKSVAITDANHDTHADDDATA